MRFLNDEETSKYTPILQAFLVYFAQQGIICNKSDLIAIIQILKDHNI